MRLWKKIQALPRQPYLRQLASELQPVPAIEPFLAGLVAPRLEGLADQERQADVAGGVVLV